MYLYIYKHLKYSAFTMDRSTYEQLDRLEDAQAEMLDKLSLIMKKLGIEEDGLDSEDDVEEEDF